ncbi:MAG: hypothetical protein Fur0021_17010 [Candidatus Promineifilaceae bacterium]
MVIAMFLAHLIGDFVLQWNKLANWKSQATMGAFVHGLLVLVVTVSLALPFNAAWWPWAVLIGVSHIIVDTGQQWLKTRQPYQTSRLSPLARFLLDQAIHLGIIVIALGATGYLDLSQPWLGMAASWESQWWLLLVLGYVFITMPAWVLIEFCVSALVSNTPPNFADTHHKYSAILERSLITTFVILGQFLLIPLVTMPRLILSSPQTRDNQPPARDLVELLASMSLAVAIGLLLRLLVMPHL